MKHRHLGLAAISLTTCAVWLGITPGTCSAKNPTTTHSAVLLELFTSEGCSSCPPADALLEKLDREGSTSGIEAVVLSEHVDYWNHGGWRDPYSSAQYSQRQVAYAGRLRVDDVYTPQIVVDGASQFVGSDAPSVRAGIARAGQQTKANVRISPAGQAPSLRVTVEVSGLPNSGNGKQADVYLAVAENHATSQVSGGENGGRRLDQVAVVRSLKLIGKVAPDGSFRQEIPITLEPGQSANRLRLVAFVQEHGQGRVLGAAMQPADAEGIPHS